MTDAALRLRPPMARRPQPYCVIYFATVGYRRLAKELWGEAPPPLLAGAASVAKAAKGVAGAVRAGGGGGEGTFADLGGSLQRRQTEDGAEAKHKQLGKLHKPQAGGQGKGGAGPVAEALEAMGGAAAGQARADVDLEAATGGGGEPGAALRLGDGEGPVEEGLGGKGDGLGGGEGPELGLSGGREEADGSAALRLRAVAQLQLYGRR